MPICAPCRVPHTPEACEDTTTGRHGLARRCYCQHKPRQAVAWPTEASPGPEPETPEPETPEPGTGDDVLVRRQTMTTTHEQGEQQ